MTNELMLFQIALNISKHKYQENLLEYYHRIKAWVKHYSVNVIFAIRPIINIVEYIHTEGIYNITRCRKKFQ